MAHNPREYVPFLDARGGVARHSGNRGAGRRREARLGLRARLAKGRELDSALPVERKGGEGVGGLHLMKSGPARHRSANLARGQGKVLAACLHVARTQVV